MLQQLNVMILSSDSGSHASNKTLVFRRKADIFSRSYDL